MTQEKLKSLIINKLTQEQYNTAKEAGQINSNELYFISDVGYVTINELNMALANKLDKDALPEYILPYNSVSEFPSVGDTNKLYIDTTEYKLYAYINGSYKSVGGGSNTEIDYDQIQAWINGQGFAHSADVEASINAITNGTTKFSKQTFSSTNSTHETREYNTDTFTSRVNDVNKDIIFKHRLDFNKTGTYYYATEDYIDNKLININTFISNHTDEYNALNNKVNNFLDVDDTTKDQLSEIISMIESSDATQALANKQDKITSENKLDYSLISNTPDLSNYREKNDFVFNTYNNAEAIKVTYNFDQSHFLTLYIRGDNNADFGTLSFDLDSSSWMEPSGESPIWLFDRVGGSVASKAYVANYSYSKNEIDNKGYLTSHQSLSNYYTKQEVDAAISNASSVVKFRDWSD